MFGSREFRELLIADVALMRGVAPARDIALALQRYWEERGRTGASFAQELASIARLAPEALEPVVAETDRMIAAAGGDPGRALTDRGGISASIQGAILRSKPPETEAAPSREPLRPLSPDRYENFIVAGEGGMGVVYMAWDRELKRYVAFKIVQPPGDPRSTRATPTTPLDVKPPSLNDDEDREKFQARVARFLREARVTGGLEHPGVVPIYEMGKTSEGIPYYTMRFVRGQRTLTHAMEEARGKGIEERLRLLEPFLRLCDTVAYAHSRNVVHRDIKPDNVALGEFGEVVLLDWGLAKLVAAGAESRWPERVHVSMDTEDLRTLEGMLGTPGYVSPEAMTGPVENVGTGSDVYSLGVVLFEILTGRLPYTPKVPFDIRAWTDYREWLTTQDAPLARSVDAAVPEALSDLCARALARDAGARIPSATDLAAGVREWQTASAREQEIQGLLRDARGALDAAETLSGADLLKQVERAAGLLHQAHERDPRREAVRALGERIAALRGRGLKEYDRLASRRTLVRAAFVALALAAVAGVIVAGLLETRRSDAVAARVRADDALVGQQKAEARVRGLALAQAARAEEDPDTGLSLLLANEAVAVYRSADTLRQLHSSIARSRFITDLPAYPIAVSADGNTFVYREADLPQLAFGFGGNGDGVGDSSSNTRVSIRDLLGRELASIQGLPAVAMVADFAPSSGHLVLGLKDGTVAVCGKSYEVAASRKVHLSAVTSIGFTASNGHAVTRAEGEPAMQITSADGKQVGEMKLRSGAVLKGGEVSVDGKHVLLFGSGTAEIYSDNGTLISRIGGPGDDLRWARFSIDGQKVLTTSGANTVSARDLSGKQLGDWEDLGAELDLDTAVLLPNGRLVIGGRGAHVRDWTAGYGFDLGAQPGGVEHFGFSPDTGTLIMKCCGGASTLWSPGFRQIALLPDSQRRVSWNTCRFGRGRLVGSGRLVATADSLSSGRLWRADTAEGPTLRGSPGAVAQVLVASDDSYVLACVEAAAPLVWKSDGSTATPLREGQDPSSGPSVDPTFRVGQYMSEIAYDPESDRNTSLGEVGGVYSRATAPSAWLLDDGHRILTHEREQVREWRPDGSMLERRAPVEGRLHSSATSSESRLALLQASTGELSWYSPAGEFIFTMHVPGAQIVRVAVSPDGRRLASVAKPTMKGGLAPNGAKSAWTLTCWGSAGGVIAQRMDVPGPPTGMMFKDGGRQLVLRYRGATSRIWEVETDKWVLDLDDAVRAREAPTADRFESGMFADLGEELSADWRSGYRGHWTTLATRAIPAGTQSWPAHARLWVAPGGRRMVLERGGAATLLDEWGSSQASVPMSRWADGVEVSVVRFSSGGRWTALALGAPVTRASHGVGRLLVFDEAGGLVGDLTGHEDQVTALEFSSSGDRLYAGDELGTVRTYLMDPDALVALGRARATRTFTAQERAQFRDLLSADSGEGARAEGK